MTKTTQTSINKGIGCGSSEKHGNHGNDETKVPQNLGLEKPENPADWLHSFYPALGDKAEAERGHDSGSCFWCLLGLASEKTNWRVSKPGVLLTFFRGRS